MHSCALPKAWPVSDPLISSWMDLVNLVHPPLPMQTVIQVKVLLRGYGAMS